MQPKESNGKINRGGIAMKCVKEWDSNKNREDEGKKLTTTTTMTTTAATTTTA